MEVAGDGPPALLWHSLCVDRAVWSRVRDDLAAHRRLLMVDAPGTRREHATDAILAHWSAHG